MGVGKILCVLGGILTIIATFLFSFAHDGSLSFYYIGLFLDIASVFQSNDWLLIVLILVFIVIMLSGILILMGVKNRPASIVGSILAITFTLYFIFTIYNILPENFGQYINVFAREPLIDDIFPIDIPIGGETSGIKVSIGTYLMLSGGLIGFVGGITSSSSY